MFERWLTVGGSVTYTESGAVGLSLNCYPLFGGTNCEAVTQINVPISFLEQTSSGNV